MTKLPTNPAGAPVLTCDLDEKCVKLDCEDLLADYPMTLGGNPEIPDYVVHYCGLDYLEKRRQQTDQADTD